LEEVVEAALLEVVALVDVEVALLEVVAVVDVEVALLEVEVVALVEEEVALEVEADDPPKDEEEPELVQVPADAWHPVPQ